MNAFIDTLTSFPTAVYTVLLGVVLIYWLLAIIGLVDFENSGFDAHHDFHHDVGHDFDHDAGDLLHGHGHGHGHGDAMHGQQGGLGAVASFVVAFGLSGVPFSIVVSLLTLYSWFFTSLTAEYLLGWVPTPLLQFVAGLVVMVLAFVVAVPLTAVSIRPLRGLFVTHNAVSKASLVGELCRIATLEVTAEFGRAEVATRGMSHNIKVWADTPNKLTKGAVARIIDYDPAQERYLVVEETD